MQTIRAPLALFVRVLVAVQILLSLSNPLVPLAAAPSVRPVVQGPKLDFESLLAPVPRNVPSPVFASPLPTPTPTPAVALPTPEPTPPPQLQADPLGTIDPAGGRLSSPDGRVTLEFPAGAVDAAVEVQFQLKRTLALTTTQQGIALRFDLEAYGRDASGLPQPVTRFARPLTLTVSLTGLVSLDRLAGVGRPYLAYVGPDGRWVEVLVHANRQTGVLTAQVDHFSGWGAGVTTPNMWTLTYNPPQADLFSGAASYRIPLQVPAGRDGVQPQLALSYNSRRLDGQAGSNTPSANPLPEGWSLDVMDITRDRWWWCDWGTEEDGPCFGDVFSLILNGTAYELSGPAQQYGRYYAKDAPQLYVYRHNDCDDGDCNSQNGAPNTTGEYWIVRQPDGTEARLGYSGDAEQKTTGICPNGPGCGQYGYRGRVANTAVRRWRVDTITSTYGYTATFAYDEYADGSPFDSRSTLRRIRYNTGLTEVELAGNAGAQPTINTVVVTNTSGSGVKTMVRKYVLGRGQMTKSFRPECGQDTIVYTTLSSVQEYGLGGALLPAQVFTYTLFRAQPDECDCPLPRLTSVNNGYGGLTDVAYESDGVPLYTWRVQGVRNSGGVAGGGPAISTTFAYGPACYDQWIDDGYNHNTNPCISRATYSVGKDGPRGPVVGHSAVTQTHWSESGALLARSTHQFHIDQAALVGRERQVRQLDPAGALLQQQDTRWISTTFGLTTTFAYAAAVTTTQGGQVSRVSYEYNPAQQGGAQYGNRTVEFYHGDLNVTGDERTVRRLYYPMTSARWIVNAPARETVYTGVHTNDDDSNVASRTCYQYDGLAYSQPPTAGSLTAESRWQGLPASNVCTNLSGYVTTRASYDTWGNPVVVTDALSHTTRTQYDSQYHLFPIVITDAVTSRVRYDYDWARGLVLTMTDANSAATGYRYDALGRLTKVIRPGDTETYPTVSYVYADGAAPWKIETWQRETSGCSGCTWPIFSFYDGLGRLLQTRAETVNGSQQAVTNVVYDALGRKESEYLPEFESYTGAFSRPAGWDARPRTTTQYDALGRTTVITAPDGTTTRTGYWGWTTTITDANGHRRDSIADAHGRLAVVKEYSGTVVYTTTYAYDALDHLTRVTDTLGNTTVITYNGLGLKTGMRDPDMGVWSYAYDLAGNLITQTDALSQRVWFKYDALNRVIEKRQTGIGGPLLASYGYDSGSNGKGRRTAMTDTTGSATWAYDARGRVTQESKTITGAGTFATSYGYDAMDRMVTMTYPSGEVVTQTYNNAAQLTTVRSATYNLAYAGGMTYNSTGQLVQMTHGNNLATTYTFTPHNLRLQRIQTGSLLDLSYAYDAAGNVKSILDKPTIAFSDTFSGLSQWTVVDGTWAVESGELSQNNDSSSDFTRRSIRANSSPSTFADGRVLVDVKSDKTYAINNIVLRAANSNLNANNQIWVRLDHRSESWRQGLHVFEDTNGVEVDRCHYYFDVGENQWYRLMMVLSGVNVKVYLDGVLRLDCAVSKTAAGYWGLQAETNHAHFDNVSLSALSPVVNLAYDALDRLTGASGEYTETYQYNAIGNLTSKGTNSYTYGAQSGSCPDGALSKPHAVVTAGTNTYCYDRNGNMVRRNIGSTYNLTYDLENRLTGVSGGATATFAYDGDGQRVKATVNGVTTAYVGNHYEVNLTTGVTTSYYYAGSTRVAMRQAGVVSYLHGDHLNSASLATNAGGGQVANSLTRYYPYGGTRSGGSGMPTEYRYTGQRREAGLGGVDGLYFYNARWYDPSLGRFLSADTMVPSLGNPQSLNRYSYALNNALKYTDPTGHYAFEEDPYDPWSYGTNVRSEHYYTHPNYRAGNQSDAQFLAGATAPIWVPVMAMAGAEEIGEIAYIIGGGIKGLVAWLAGAACGDGDCTNEARSLQGVIDRGFGGDRSLFEQFMRKLHSALPSGTRVAIRGSTLTGSKWSLTGAGRPFDALAPGTSDLDLALIGEEAMAKWSSKAFSIPGINTLPLSDKMPHIAPALNPTRVALQQMVGRPVNLQAMPQWFLEIRQVFMRQPYLILP